MSAEDGDLARRHDRHRRHADPGREGARGVGARRIVAYAVHPVLSGPAVERIQSSNIEEVVVTDTIPLRENALKCRKITTLSVAKIFGEAIRRIHSADSLSTLFV